MNAKSAQHCCPEQNELRAFNDGRVDGQKIDQIGEHLAECQKCVQLLESMQLGPLELGLRQTVNSEDSDELKIIEHAGVQLDWSTIPRSPHPNLGLERYALDGLLAEGPFTDVYLARNDVNERVIIKLPHRDKITAQDKIQIFFGDAGIASKLSHPNIVPLLDFGHWQDDLLFAAYEFCEMQTLTQFAKKKTLGDSSEIQAIFSQLCEAIEHAHRKKVLHRHLHPNNIFLKRESDAADFQVAVTDFSLHFDGRYQFELIEPLFDYSPFVSPEAINNDPEFIDQRTDIFSLGKVLKLLMRITPGLDVSQNEKLVAIREKCTLKRRRDRFQTMPELTAELLQ